MTYCAGCGEKKKLRYDEGFCSQRCAARMAAELLEVGDGSDFHCKICGEFGCPEYH